MEQVSFQSVVGPASPDQQQQMAVGGTPIGGGGGMGGGIGMSGGMGMGGGMVGGSKMMSSGSGSFLSNIQNFASVDQLLFAAIVAFVYYMGFKRIGVTQLSAQLGDKAVFAMVLIVFVGMVFLKKYFMP